MPPRQLPRATAVFTRSFIFTTLTQRDVDSHSRVPFVHPVTDQRVTLFSLDGIISYKPFAKDHGPINISYILEACYKLEATLDARKGRCICLYTNVDPISKSNVMLVAACFYLIHDRVEPWVAYEKIAHMEALPFRDAGSGPNHHGLYIEDCLYGLDKALRYGLVDLHCFSKTWYRYYEQVANGDLNILGDFIAFASPMEETYVTRYNNARLAVQKKVKVDWYDIPKATQIEPSFQKVLDVFQEKDVGIVVRLNDVLYDKEHFENMGIEHVELYFDDGTNPSDEIVRWFIELAEDTIEKKGKRVAVHCKAGLGRTGVLIGAYLIYKYHFSAQEAIAYMRLIRPGMVVGDQQQFMLRNQMRWVSWAARDELLKELAAERSSPEPVNPLATPPADSDPPSPYASVQRRSRGDSHIFEELTARLGSGELAAKPVPVFNIDADAIGQPRKGRPPVGTQDGSRRKPDSGNEDTIKASPPIQASAIPPTPLEVELRTPASASTSSRGTKRGSSRLPMPSSMVSTRRTTRSAGLSPPIDLQRSSSIVSVALTDTSEATSPARKRPMLRLASSPLGKTGLSSPPPSRETTPLEGNAVAAASPTFSLKVANKLRRKPAIDRTAVRTTDSRQEPTTPISCQQRVIPSSMRKSGPVQDVTPRRNVPSLDETAERKSRKAFSPPRLLGFG